MERIDHVDIVQVSRCCLICQVDRMFQRNVPDRESLEFRISGTDTSAMLLIKLR